MWSDAYLNYMDKNFEKLTKDIFMEELIEKVFEESESIIDKKMF